MFSWLVKKNQNARVHMCIKEVKWTLETFDPVRRATILVMASGISEDLFDNEDIGIPLDVVNRPLDYSRNDLMGFYEILEDVHNNQALQRQQTKKMLVQMGMEFPEFAEENAKDANTALNIWMVTVGSGIVIDRRDDVRDIWRLLIDSRPFIADAITHILQIQELTAQMTGQEVEIMDEESVDIMKQLSNFCPEQFSKELNI
tara:strand:- start:594 stop:1199 length:606 start_codon:yes stop_codon:yes gene_type:complete